MGCSMQEPPLLTDLSRSRLIPEVEEEEAR